MIPSRRADLYNSYLIELIARAAIPRLCYQAAELAYTTSYPFSIPKGELRMDQQTAPSDFCLPLAPGQANPNKTISCNIVCIAKHSHYAIIPRSKSCH
jgi:hypothetical protein